MLQAKSFKIRQGGKWLNQNWARKNYVTDCISNFETRVSQFELQS